MGWKSREEELLLSLEIFPLLVARNTCVNVAVLGSSGGGGGGILPCQFGEKGEVIETSTKYQMERSFSYCEGKFVRLV